MRMASATMLAAGLVLAATPAHAAIDDVQAARVAASYTPATQLDASQRENYRAIFAELRAQDWAGAAGRLDGMREGPLHDLARALLYTMPGSPRVELQPVMTLLQRNVDLPQAEALARIARARGAEAVPELPNQQRLVGLGGQPRRARPRNIRGDEVADRLEPLLQPLIRDDKPVEAEALLASRAEELSPEALTAFRQRIAWVYYLNGLDSEARRVGDLARTGPTEYGIHAEWVSGLAAWRMGDYDSAAAHFANVGGRSSDVEFSAAGHYWAARADTAGGHPERVQPRLRTAARLNETFYGLLAQSALGIRQPPADMTGLSEADWRQLAGARNVRMAVALAEIGETDLAGELLRHQARIGRPGEHGALIHLAARLNLTAAQMWLSHNGPRGAHYGPRERYPNPSWRPARGWRVDPALAFAHALQESNFRPDAVSPAGARGLMQVRPGTAGDLIRWRGIQGDPGRLTDPVNNIEFGQTYLEYLRDMESSGGLLPKVIASYNAGPAPIAEWNVRYDQSDPLLYIESIPYWETRGYVPIILRNYWIYEARNADQSITRRALAQGMWPRFPGLSGPSAIRIPPRNRQAAMGQD